MITPKLGTTRTVTESKAQGEAERPQIGQIKPNTPKKATFYSDYLRDYNPRNVDFRSPIAGSKKETTERPGRSYSGTSLLNQFSSKQQPAAKTENTSRTQFTEERSYYSTRPEPLETHKDDIRPRAEEKKEVRASPVRDTDNVKSYIDETDRRARDMKKEDIRTRLSKLNEQFLSPIKPPDSRALMTEENSISLDFKDQGLFKRTFEGHHQAAEEPKVKDKCCYLV